MNTTLPTGTLILGVGNTLLGDEGAGVHALDLLAARLGEQPGVTLLDGGTLSFTLLPTLERYYLTSAVIVSAAGTDTPRDTLDTRCRQCAERLAQTYGRPVNPPSSRWRTLQPRAWDMSLYLK